MSIEPSLREKLKENNTETLQAKSFEGSHSAAFLPGGLTGKKLDNKFELIAFVGSGGMSEVYKARHLITGKTFAVKVLHEKRAQDELTIRRLKQEAQAAGALTHNNILGIHDFGIDESGLPFLVMDFIDGQSLSELLKSEGPLKLDRFLNIMQQVAAALAHAQDHKVVHRDMKPSNIMISNHDGKEQVKIVDFGIAKLLNDDEQTIQRLTQTGEMFGSPLYMSPEQCTGAKVDSRSDIYSFGCVMYEALTGVAPHAGETVFETVHHHINSLPPALKAPQIEDVVAPRIEGIVLRCLAKMPQDRYQRASQIAGELRKLEHTTGGGALSQIENAWNLVHAKHAAKRKTKIPMLVAILCLVSLLSIASSLSMVYFGLEFKRSYERLDRANIASSQFFRCYLELTRIYKFGQVYLFTRNPTWLHDIDVSHKHINREFDETEILLAEEPEIRARYRTLREAFECGVQQFHEKIDSVPQNANFIQCLAVLRSFAKESNSVQDEIMTVQSTEREKLRLLSQKVRSDQASLILSGILAAILNSAVLVTVAILVLRQRAQLQKQKEQITDNLLEKR